MSDHRRHRPGGTVGRGVSGNHAILTRDGTTRRLSTREFADVSPDGRLVSIENDAEENGPIFDATTGAENVLNHGYWWAIGYQWLDVTTLGVLAFDGTDGNKLGNAWPLTSDGLSGECDTPGPRLPSGIGDFQLPIGIHLEG